MDLLFISSAVVSVSVVFPVWPREAERLDTLGLDVTRPYVFSGPSLVSRLSGRGMVSEQKLPEVFYVPFPEYTLVGLLLAACFSISFLPVSLSGRISAPKRPQEERLQSSPLIMPVWPVLKISF